MSSTRIATAHVATRKRKRRTFTSSLATLPPAWRKCPCRKKFASRKIQSRYDLAIKAIGITVIVISNAGRASTVNVFTLDVMTVARSTILVISSWFKRQNDVVKHAELRERERHAMPDCDANRWKFIRPPARTRYSRSEFSAELQRWDGCQILMR